MIFKRFLKFLFIFLLIIGIPIFTIIIVFYINDKYYLNKFLVWIKQPGNISILIISIGLYLPFINGLWKLILNFIETIKKSKELKRDKINKKMIYDDHKNNYIYYDEKNKILDIQFQANEDIPINKFIDLISNELKIKLEKYEKDRK